MTEHKILVIQSDHTILAEAGSPFYPEVRSALSRFAELVKSPEYLHTYAVNKISLWNAASAGVSLLDIQKTLSHYSKYTIPQNVSAEIEHAYSLYGRVSLVADETDVGLKGPYRLIVNDPLLTHRLKKMSQESDLVQPTLQDNEFLVKALDRGRIKQVLIKMDMPIIDLVGYGAADSLAVSLRQTTLLNHSFLLRDYQTESAEIFYQNGESKGGNGVIVLPCGAGKTIVGLAAMARLQTHTLILVTSVAAAHQWIREILDKTHLEPDQVGEYSGEHKNIRPITIATYNILTHKNKKTEASYPHFELFNAHRWGLVIYDEVHMLPAPVFSMTAGIQSTRRLGLTATLVREDGKEAEVFSLVGPKRYDVPWKTMETKGWIAEAHCFEIRIPLSPLKKSDYMDAEDERIRYRVASSNPAKIDVVKTLLQKHRHDSTLIIGHYIDQLNLLERELNIPLITGQTPNSKRETLYQQFREGSVRHLLVSRVANFSIDLPDASVLIQVSGLFGSRQEEAQRLGRILRPKEKSSLATFYSVVTNETEEVEFARHRQLFLTEQGYRYNIEEWSLADAVQPLA